MKLSVEIVNSELKYHYKFGVSEQTASMPLTETLFVLLAELLRQLHNGVTRSHEASTRETIHETTAKAWITKNIEEAQKFIDQCVKNIPEQKTTSK